MQKVNLYKYEYGSFVTVTPNKRNETDTPSLMRLIADDGYILANGTTTTPAIDINLEDVGLWSEVIETNDETSLKAQAYDILMGVTE